MWISISVFALISIIALNLLVNVFSNRKLKQRYGIPSYWSLISADLGNSKNKRFFRKGKLVGSPDALFALKPLPFVPIFLKAKIIEVKSRNMFPNKPVTDYERKEVILYHYLIKKKHIAFNLESYLFYRNGHYRKIEFDPKILKFCLSQIRPLIKARNKF